MRGSWLLIRYSKRAMSLKRFHTDPEGKFPEYYTGLVVCITYEAQASGLDLKNRTLEYMLGLKKWPPDLLEG